ncbi:type VI secretion system protein TssA [Xanthomonas sp. NCPPB 2654]|uniref:type VI secretion system protein TssA n=1 Tax=unclassified Xanthomonas TaxID=2643310 RepID=UPI0021DFB7EB|nr:MULTISPECIES: type VI secretion system protein TssA [unclassified Xanthomonas]MDL5364033.1 type VI secretion system protein TssA [Xanthomonas sp. NCPPB 2654]UYC20964.1 type VI secretion system protein TssA [Xanthomonas sp. CFBP 8443]
MTTEHSLDALLAPIAEDAASGPDLEYDPDFLALDRAAANKAERAVGDSVIAAEEPDWDKVQTLALALFRRSHDLRVAIHLSAAWLRLRGLPGWADGLALLHALLAQRWDSVHPQLDAEDDDDPTARVNAVVALVDPLGLLGALRATAFVQSPRLGRFSLRDLRVANGSVKPANAADSVPSLTEIEACCLDCPVDALGETVAAVQRALQSAREVDALFAERIGSAAPDFKPLLGDLRDLERFLLPQWTARTGGSAEGEGDADVGQAEGGAAAPAGGGGNARIASPDDVMRRLDEICAYYASHEPSSPVPLLLRRAQRLVGRNFLDLLKELAPGGVSELQHVAGVRDEDA